MSADTVTVERPPPPTDDELIEVLRDAFPGRKITAIARWPFYRASSYALEELTLSFADGGTSDLMFKDLAWERLLDVAARRKPSFLYDPRRDVETHRCILAPEKVGPHCYAAVADLDRGRYWLLLERVPGHLLGKIDAFDVWEVVASWLGRFHARFVGRVAEVRAANPFLLEYDVDLYRTWCKRALTALEQSQDPRAGELLTLLAHYDDVAEALAARRTTFIHGEFYPSNVLVDFTYGDLRVCPVDWEVSAIGPGMLDLAAMAGGRWSGGERTAFLAAYRKGMEELGAEAEPWDDMVLTFQRCQLHLALQWLGWSPGYKPPSGRRNDWIGEAIRAAYWLEAANR